MAIHKLKWGWVRSVTKNGRYGDGGNLWLQVTNRGAAKSWLFRYTSPITKREKEIGLGSANTIDLDGAREEARQCRKLLMVGKDPQIERDGERLDADIAAGRVRTVREVFNEFFTAKLSHIRKSTQEKVLWVVGKFLLDRTVVPDGPMVGDMPIAKIDQGIANKILSEIWFDKNPTATVLQGHAKRLISFAKQRGYYKAEGNPFAWTDNLEHSLPSGDDVHVRKSHPSLPYQDLGRFMQAVRSYRDRSQYKFDYPTVALWLEFVVLTGVRTNEVRLARWNEFDFTTMVWTIPPEHHKIGRKTQKPHLVPITPQMLTILEEMQRRRTDPANDALAFPSDRMPGKPYAHSAITVFVSRQIRWETKITAHGFRSTLQDWCRAHHKQQTLFELQVGHLLGNKVGQAYGHDPMLEQRRVMMAEYGAYCSQLPPEPGSNVENLSEWRKTAS